MPLLRHAQFHTNAWPTGGSTRPKVGVSRPGNLLHTAPVSHSELIDEPGSRRSIIGTSGFSYKEWRGHFYPEGLSEKDFLSFYAERLPGVEINNTFYRMPKTDVLAAWASRVPESFLFAVKAPRRITHMGRLKNVEAFTDTFLSALTGLGQKLGVVLFQLPPNMKCDVDRLAQFLKHLARRVPVTFEFRNDSWFSEPVYQLLREYDVPMCVGDPDDKAPPPPLIWTASWAYARLRQSAYGEHELAHWARHLRSIAETRSFVFFKHEQLGPSYAARLLELLET